MTPPLSEAEFDRQFTAASKRGTARRANQPLAVSVDCHPDRGVMICLNNGCQVIVPLRLLPEIQGADPNDLFRVGLMGDGQAIEWPTLDQQFDVLQLLADALGLQRKMSEPGRRGGRVKSKAKTKAAST